MDNKVTLYPGDHVLNEDIKDAEQKQAIVDAFVEAGVEKGLAYPCSTNGWYAVGWDTFDGTLNQANGKDFFKGRRLSPEQVLGSVEIYTLDNFHKDLWKLLSDISDAGYKVGDIQVVYTDAYTMSKEKNIVSDISYTVSGGKQ